MIRTSSELVTRALLALGVAAAAACNDPVHVSPVLGGRYEGRGTKVRVFNISKVDVLFVVDNSSSMADKQAELARRIPELIFALTDSAPDPDTGKLNRVIDVHVAVISSSLGSHGTAACDPEASAGNDDQGHLLPREGTSFIGKKGYTVTALGGTPIAVDCPSGLAITSALTWTFDGTGAGQFKGTTGATMLQAASSCVVASVGETGCGYEETWESAYHFLVDPKPYISAKVKCTGDACGSNEIEVAGVDDEILKQRAAFLRDDSLLAVVVLSDENDASLKPAGLDWLPWAFAKSTMPRGWAKCADVPDDFEPESGAEFEKLHTMYGCKSCYEDASDPSCKKPWATDPLGNDIDDRNLRAFNQTTRFGYNFLWGRQRYVSAFTNATAIGSDGVVAANPIFKGGFRTQDLVLVAGIVGVPPGLVAANDGTPKELRDADWAKIAGPIGTRDPHMIESIAPRVGIPKFAGDRSVDVVNGGDRDISGDDLQYACIAPRAEKIASSDCSATDSHSKNPLCDATEQSYFKAYPGLRHLRIIKDLGASGFVASICNSTYSPAMQGIVKKMRAVLGSQCITTEVAVKDNKANCVILEAMAEGTFPDKTCEQIAHGLCTPGARPCRVEGTDYPPLDIEAAAALTILPITVINPTTGVSVQESVTARVDPSRKNVIVKASDGKIHTVCETLQLVGDAKAHSCRTDPKFKLDPATDGGWCYSQDLHVLSKSCTLGTIRFGGGAEPRNKSEVFIFCSPGAG